MWQMIDVGLRSNFVAAWHAAQIMVSQKSGLIVAISGYVGVTYTYDVVFGACKTATDRMARDMAIELKPYHVASLSLWQGFTYTERAQENLRKVSSMASQLNSAAGCSVEFPGRIIAALAQDPDVIKRSGGTFIAAELAQEYGIRDIDGRMIPSLRAERGAPIWMPV
jgi:NAD(P)-dependent dehydrogenase (short-subunit alcohol dehydrogenase family)